MALTIEDLRAQDFARGYNWEVKFPDFSGNFFPAYSFNDEFVNFASGSMDYGPEVFYFPEKAWRGKNLSIEIYEFDNYPVIEWLQEWYKSIKAEEYSIHLLGEYSVAKQMIILRYNLQKAPVSLEILHVIPEGNVSVSYVSDKGSPLALSLNLIVVGKDS